MKLSPENQYGALAALELVARCFESSPRETFSKAEIMDMLRSGFPDELVKEGVIEPEAVVAFRVATTPGSFEALESLRKEIAAKRMKPC